MGQNQTKDQTTSPKANYTPEVEVLQEKFQNANYGEVKLVKDVATEQVMILKEIVVNTKQAFDAEVQFLNNRIEISQPNVAEIVGYNIKDQQNFCSTYYKISIYIENLEQTLQAQVEERIANSYTYTETELLQVADSLVSGLSYFQSQGFSHGDIRPTNIFVQGTTYKLSDPSLSAQKGQNGLSLAIIQGAKTYLAPELIAQVPKSDFEIKTDKYKADVFSLGLTLLSLATLSNVEELYNFEEGTINETLLADKLERIRYRYSPFTFDLIASMITISEEARPDFVALSNTLLPYQENIRSGASLYLYSQTETVKRSALPDDYSNTNYINSTNDDLEARIRAALERSEQTFRAVAARDHTFVHTHETQPNADLAKSYVAENTTPATEQVAPVQVTETVTTTTYTTYTPVDVNATTTYTPVDVNATYTPATTDYTSTYQYTPSTYNYTTTTYTPYTVPVEEKKPEGLLEKIEHAVEHVVSGRDEPHHHHHHEEHHHHHEPAQVNATADVTINS